MNRIGRTVKLSAAVTVLAVLGIATPARALPANWTETEYYSDATHSHVVGTRWVNCTNPVITQEGQITAYHVLVASGPC